MPDSQDRAGERVWRAMPAGSQEALEFGLPPTDLQTLLIGIAKTRADRTTPADVMRRWQQDRFVQPAVSDPRRVAAVEARLWQLLPAEFTGVDLSPVTPLGTSSAVTPVSQNRVVATVRNTEVVSDSTNALAVEAATRRHGQPGGRRIDLACCHRQLRAQVFGPGAVAHFRLFALVSSARDSGSGRTEADMLTRHLAYWLTVLQALVPHRQPQIELSVFDDAVLAERLTDTVRPGLTTGLPSWSTSRTAPMGGGTTQVSRCGSRRTRARPNSATAASPTGQPNSRTTPRNAASCPVSPPNASRLRPSSPAPHLMGSGLSAVRPTAL